jgi:hypothetical protein
MVHTPARRVFTLAIMTAAVALASTAKAATISLLADGTTSFSDNSTNTIFSLTDIQPAGSGVFNPFVRIQNTGAQQGYNTKFPADTMDNAMNGPAEPTITMDTVVDAFSKINLALDYNEGGADNKSPIYLESLVLVVSTNPDKSGPDATNPWSVLGIPQDVGDVVLFDMATSTRTDAGHVGELYNIYIDANNNLASGNGGSGQADLLVQIDLSSMDLSGLVDSNHYLYVYSRFSGADTGFEEWRIQSVTNPNVGVPEPASLGLLGIGAAAMLTRKRRKN